MSDSCRWSCGCCVQFHAPKAPVCARACRHFSPSALRTLACYLKHALLRLMQTLLTNVCVDGAGPPFISTFSTHNFIVTNTSMQQQVRNRTRTQTLDAHSHTHDMPRHDKT